MSDVFHTHVTEQYMETRTISITHIRTHTNTTCLTKTGY